MPDLTGLVAVVTGGASGLGAACVNELRSRGCRVAVFDRIAVEPTRADLSVIGDVSDDASVLHGIDAIASQLGGIDVIVNNAGIGATGDVATNPDEEWRAVFDVNVFGVARVTRAAMPLLHRSRHPAVVNITSAVTYVGVPDRVLYTATKGAVAAMTLAMAADHVKEGIRFNAVAPGTADTPWIARLLASADDAVAAADALRRRQPLGRLVAPEDVAYAVANLASPRSSSVTGSVVVVDGGMSTLRVAT